MKNDNLVFVYGTLMSGCFNNVLLKQGNATLVQTGNITGEMYDLGCFPGVKLRGTNTVKGEVWEVDQSTLSLLDRLEGEGRLYRRTKACVADYYRGACDVWVYEIIREPSPDDLISSGDWKERD